MSFTTPELILSSKKNPKDCSICNIHVNNARASSWEYNICPRCYITNEEKKSINTNPLNTVAKTSIYSPITSYLNKYTISEMRNIKK